MDQLNVTNPEQIAENDTLKILMIGNSHGVDATKQLNEVFKKAAPGKKVIIGALYHSGCRIDQHLDFITNNKGEYIYYKIDESMTNWTRIPPHVVGEDGKLVSGEQANGSILCGATLDLGLKDEKWDFIVLQQMSTYAAYDGGEFNFDQLDALICYVRSNATGNPKLYWFDTWAHPNDDVRVATYSGIGYGSRWYNQHKNFFALSQHKMYNMLISNVKTKIFNRIEHGDLDGVIDTATAVQYMQDVLGLPEHMVFRDGTHLCDYARVMTSAIWYSTFTGDVMWTAEKLPASIPEKLATASYPTDRILTLPMRADLVKVLTYALTPENRFSLPSGTMESERITYANTKDGLWVCGELVADLCVAMRVGDFAVEKVTTAKDNTVTITFTDRGDVVLSRENENLMTVCQIDESLTAMIGIKVGAEFTFQAK